jgi:pimeloyl-ACP methyl ester carboxylesterase
MAGSEDVVLAVAEGAWVSQPATVQLAGGRQATYEVVGTGEPLLWIEGGPGFPADLGRPDVALLADRFCCYLIDAPGCGGSTPPAERRDWDHLGHARFFDEVRQALGLGPVTVMGHSWGGLIALTYAALAPAAIARCIVVDGYAGVPDATLVVFADSGHVPAYEEPEAFRRAVLDWCSAHPIGEQPTPV